MWQELLQGFDQEEAARSRGQREGNGQV